MRYLTLIRWDPPRQLEVDDTLFDLDEVSVQIRLAGFLDKYESLKRGLSSEPYSGPTINYSEFWNIDEPKNNLQGFGCMGVQDRYRDSYMDHQYAKYFDHTFTLTQSKRQHTFFMDIPLPDMFDYTADGDDDPDSGDSVYITRFPKLFFTCRTGGLKGLTFGATGSNTEILLPESCQPIVEFGEAEISFQNTK